MLKISKIVFHIAVLYVIFLFGNLVQQTFNLFVPGSVIGMIVFLIFLLTGIIKVSWIEEGTKLFVNHLTLFFIPATVGVMNYMEIFSATVLWVVGIVLISTALVMAIAGMVSQWLIRKKEFQHE
ncbi:CidA/LrgA family protein [Oceanobacillus damuensis]|uniref:CidA/LrgA family protein n=1 Tax=Oceanobacillus damuensis TaxID=937928 RepID=UPI000A967FA8|nr:CidA/LrgA family protein [Oceanobacillus damuensis]